MALTAFWWKDINISVWNECIYSGFFVVFFTPPPLISKTLKPAGFHDYTF